MKTKINAFDYAGSICNALRKGVLLTTKMDGFVNTMTIGWGKIGIEWNRPVFIAYVRESRFTKEILETNPEFTVNVPLGSVDNGILRYCGSESGRNEDKIKAMGLTLENPNLVSVPGIKEFPLTLECRVIYKQRQNAGAIPDSIIDRFYPETGTAVGRDVHIAFYGEIVDAYLIQE